MLLQKRKVSREFRPLKRLTKKSLKNKLLKMSSKIRVTKMGME